MFNVNDISIVIPVKGHKRFVKCVEFDPKGKYLVMSDDFALVNTCTSQINIVYI
jgi:WD40 repeat protein